MAESLSTTAGVIGIFGVVAHSLHVVYNDIDAIRGAPKEMNDLKKELQVVELAIANLRLQARNIFDENAGLETAISKCQQACETFHANLSKWTKRSEDGKLQFRDAVYFALLRQRQVEILWKRLQACKITVSIAVSGAVL
jgi:chromosome segregation ATPase